MSIAYERTDKFYDMRVPLAQNYVANHIVNHNTGIGKGRVVAAAIRYAHRTGKVPVFVTEKPDLFGDMWRDLHDIGWPQALGRPINMFMTNSGARIPLDEKAVEWVAARNAAKDAGEPIPPMEGHFSKSQTPETSSKRMAAILSGDETPDVVFTTYDQMNSVRGQETDRRSFLRRIAPRAFLILDEAHNAGGQGEQLFEEKDKAAPRSVVFRDAVTAANSVLYSSATYAKSPKVMDLFSRTDMAKAVEDPKDLAELIEKGGIPLQQVVSQMLSDAGQYMRRERSFEGVTYEPEIVPVDEASYETFTDALGTIFRFDRSFAKERAEIAQSIAKELGAGIGKDSGTGEGAASSTTFSAIMHNAISQMVLSIKAKGAAQRAIQSLKANEKPVIALSATMESFLTDMAEALGLKPGDPINADFGDVLRRYMERTRRVTIKMPDDTKKHVMIPLSDMSPGARADFEDASKFLKGIAMPGLPLSPIDAIRSELQKAGYSVREITGRSLMIDYSGIDESPLGDNAHISNPPVLAKRPEGERGSTGKRLTIKAFNDGTLDAVILNRSGSTGVSMHASEFFKDRRKRRMILVQADPNIDTHMQMLGRIHRTGQVELPAYTQLAADIPAEVRPTAVLMGKMASLNANTTASRKSKFTGESVDFMNKYGDLVAAQVLSEPEMMQAAATLDVDLKNDNGEVMPGLIAKVTGRLTLLRQKEQQAIIDRITEDYRALIARLDAEGLNDLEAKSVDLQARVVETKEIKPATGSSPFTSAVNLDKVSVKAQGRAMAPGEVLSELGGRLDQPTNADGDFAAELRSLSAIAEQRRRAMVGQVTQAAQIYAKKQVAALKKADAIAKAQDAANANLARWQYTANRATPGTIIGINFAGDDTPAIVLDFRFKGKDGSNPVSLAQWVLDLALPNQLRTLSIPASQVYTDAFPKGEKDKGGLTISSETFAPAMVEAQFENARKEGRETRFIFTGNILAAFDQADGRGQIINFTMEDGSTQAGILMNRKFDPADFMAGRAIRFKTGAQALAFLDKFPRGEIASKDNIITVRTAGGRYEFDLPAAKATGGRFFTDARVRQAYDGWEKRGSRMRATVPGPTARAMIDAMMEIGAAFETRENQAAAQEIVNADAKAPQMAQAAPKGWGYVEAADPISEAEIAKIRADVDRIISTVLPHGVAEARVVDKIELGDHEAGAVSRSGGAVEAPHIMGLFSGRPGMADLIEVAVDSHHPKNTTYHEAWHSAQHIGLATEQELAVLRSPAEAERLRRFAEGNKGPQGARQMSQVELEANYFGAYAEALDEGRAPPRIHPRSMRIFERLYELLRRLRNYFAGRGFQTTEDIIRRFQSGEMARRPFWDRGASRLYGDEAYAARFPQVGDQSPRHFNERSLKQRLQDKAAHIPDRVDSVEAILDMHTRVDAVAKELADGRRIAPDVDPYKAKRLLPGRTAASQANFRRDYLEPLVHDAKAARLTLQDIAEWLYARHAPERNAAMDAVDPNNAGRGSGITDDMAGEIIDRLTNDGKAGALANIEQRVAAIREHNISLGEDAGLLSEEQANELRAQYQNYVPLKGWDDPALEPESARELRAGGGMRVAGREFRHAFGRRTVPSDPLSNLINDSYRMIDRAEKNRALNAVWRFFRSIPSDERQGIVALDKGKMVKTLDPQTGMMVWREEAAWRFRENVVPLKIGGKPHYLVFEDPEIAKAFMRTSAYQLPFILKQMGQIINTAKSMWTHWNPDFMIRHFFLRYPIEGASNAGENGIGAVVRSFKGYPGGPAYRAIRRHAELDEAGRNAAIARLSDPNVTEADKWLGYYEELRRSGGLMNWADFGGVDRVRTKLDRALATMDRNPARAALAYGRGVHEALNIITSAMDNAQRLAAYVDARKNGASRVDAAMAAREATVDFALKGTLGNYLTLMWPFANTAAQTASRMTRATIRSKKAMAGVLSSWVALGLSAGLFAYLFGGNDKDGTPFIEKIGDWTRRLNLVIPFGPRDDKGRPYMLTISLPYNYALPFTIGQTIAALIMKSQGRSKQKASHIFGNLTHSALEAFTPVAQENSMLGKAMPELYRPFHHVSSNKNWYGGPVHPNEEPWNRGRPKAERSFRNTPEAWKMLARGLNNYTGFDAHPEDYREVMSYFTSTMQGVVARAGTAAGDAMRGEKPDPTDVPILHALIGGGKQYDAADRRAYFDARDTKYSAENKSKNLMKDASMAPDGAERAAKFRAENQKDIVGAKAFHSADAQRRALMKQMDRVKADESLSADERNRRIKVLQDRELEIMRRARAMTGD